MRKSPLARRHVLLACAALGLWASAALAGPFTGNGTQPGLAFSLLKASNCRACHGNYDAAHDVEPWPTWAGSMMAQAARDPLFWAALDVANHDAPNVGDWCLRCHVPDGWLAGRSEPPAGSTDGCALSGPLDAASNDFDGVACHFCHRMMTNPSPPAGQQSLYLENGQFWLDDSNCGGQGEPCRRAQYDYPGGTNLPPHAWAASTYHQESELCGNCHNVTNPALNLLVAGVDQGIGFPIERTYREFQLSDFASGPTGQSCQDCHMPQATSNPVYASAFQLTNRTGDMAAHRFVGGNAWVPEVLRTTYPALGLDTELAAARDGATDLLQHAATVEVLPAAAAMPGGTAHVSVKVTNLTGHKLPTGYPEGRRAWLHVEARDAGNTLLFESGAYDATTGVLTPDTQLKVYEAKQGIWNTGAGTCDTDDGLGNAQFHFAANDCIAFDDRIPPAGFTGGADLETRPVGYTYPEAAPGVLVNYDVTAYAIPIPATAVSPVTVTATLRYQTTSKEYVDFLDERAVTNAFPDDCLTRTTGPVGKTRARFLKDLWQANGRAAPVDVGLASGTAELRFVDAFGCYKAAATKGSAKFVPPAGGLALANDFESASFAVAKAHDLCAPADVGNGRVDPVTHLTAYPIKPAKGQPKHVPHTGLTVADEFGPLTLDTVKSDVLLVPSAVDPNAPPPLPGPNEVDVFACYKVKITKGAPKFPKGRQITLTDAFRTSASVMDLKKPHSLCVPTGGAGGATKHAGTRLLCYQAKPEGAPVVPRPGVFLHDAELGAARVDVKKDDMVCLPAIVGP